jgi:hypothetical protein
VKYLPRCRTEPKKNKNKLRLILAGENQRARETKIRGPST